MSEDKICNAFVKQFNELIQYNQINYPKSLKWYFVPNGQRAAGKAVAAKICGMLKRMDMIGWVAKELQTQGAIAGRRDKNMGALKGVTDYHFHWTDSGINYTGFIEVKIPGEAPFDEQIDFQEWCDGTGRLHAYAYSVTDILKTLQDWGIIKKNTIF